MGNALTAMFSTSENDLTYMKNVAKYETDSDGGISSGSVLDVNGRELSTLRERRIKVISEKRMEMEELRRQVAQLKEENALLKSFQFDDGDKTNTWSRIVEITEEIAALKQEKEHKKISCHNVAVQYEEADTGNESRKQKEDVEELRKEIVKLKREVELHKRFDCAEDTLCEMNRLKMENDGLKMILEEKSRLLEDSEKLIEKNRELRVSIAKMQKELQELNGELIEFEKERHEYNTHVLALKDVISVSKNMLQIREAQLKELKQKVETIEQSLQEKEMNLLSQDLRMEYERQLENIRSLRNLYQERSRIERLEREQMQSQLDEANKQVEREQNKNKEVEERLKKLEDDNSKKYDEIKQLESNLGLAKAESRQYQAELTVINQLFSEILLGFNNSQDIDLDRLQKQLEDHHDLLQDIVVNEVSSEVSYALPKVLLDLLNQIDTGKDVCVEKPDKKIDSKDETDLTMQTTSSKMNSPEEIVQNLPKVWRVLIELLSHQAAPTNSLSGDDDAKNPCYKTVQTPKGPGLVASVSQTFIRLKDLILEKKCLEKETNHLKQLNGHLENRLQDQEKRLELVQNELNKTWHVVGKLQKQHHMLHTQEKILRYELAQKRKLLTELKEELEYSREKWTQAREKNTSTEEQWRLLRNEFASRKRNLLQDDINNSVESGYSDDRECSSEDEPGYETDMSECAPKHEEDEEKDPLIDSDAEREKTAPEEVPTSSKDEELNSNVETLEERLARRDERLKMLESQAGELVNQAASTSNRSVDILNKLDTLHETYGEGSSSSRK